MKKRNRIWYPSVNQIVKYNKFMIDRFRATKAEKHEVLRRKIIEDSIKQTKQFPGNIKDKAAILVRTMQYHPFGSANRRTAYFVMNKFLYKNAGYMIAKKKQRGREFMRKIRKGEMTHSDIVQEIS